MIERLLSHLPKPGLSTGIVIRFFLIVAAGELVLVFVGRYTSDLFAGLLNLAKVENIPAANRLSKGGGFLGAFILMVIWAPLIEETVFRLWLRYSVKKVIISTSVAGAVLTILLIRSWPVQISGHEVVGILPLTALIFYGGLWKIRKVLPLSEGSIQQWAIVPSSLIFGVLHLSNYNLTVQQWVVAIPLIFPQIWAGLLFSRARVDHGFLYALVVHALVNSVSWIAAISW